MLLKKIIFWALAVIITLAAAVFQRMTGPTYPLDLSFEYQGEELKFELPRSHGGDTDCPVEISLPEEINGQIIYRRFPTNENWDTIKLVRDKDTLRASLPWQPPAGKLEYHLELFEGDQPVDLHIEENIVIRFKGAVPEWALLPHVLLMFFAMLWSNVTGLLAAFRIPSYKVHAFITMVLFLIGGMILGPIVQKYAFDAYWTGWPLGEDLTDNKVLLSALFWIAAVVFNRKKERRWLVIAATLVLFAVYLIPHSMNGSELDYSSGEVITGSIILVPLFFQKT